MANYTGGANAVCPFYIREADKSITCEGAIPGAENAIKFTTEEEKRRHQDRYCSTFRFGDCPTAKAIEQNMVKTEIAGNTSRHAGNTSKDLGRRIAIARCRKGWTQEQLAERSFLSRGHLSNIERGEDWPGIETLFHIADALDMDVKDFFGGGKGK